ncbi:Orotate phosphoribosyltransferase [Treponema phagedenis]|uniref:Orotate phosphoribosyltransferase n=1 Tax=Treponema phagedenis TaxID=162 RepID=A0A0B7GRG9_TREPH|nr:orotate phosphoribosyltransferase [Treponema phagedenis]EFW38559.1 orotate phosphoribosyltransferase [Treponema phagedenis F0421]CEM61018.1 Orotate phosphoribosyltransferase [Treponema phagedenis]
MTDTYMEENLQILQDCEAVLQGHFLLSSGRHSDGYAQCAKLLMYPDKAAQVLSGVVRKLKELKIDKVIGPAMGGIIVAYEIGRQLGVPAMFTERENDVMTLRRGFTVEKGDRILITEDVITTGKSSLETIEALKDFGVEIVGLAAIVDRRNGADFPYPVYAALEFNVTSYTPEECPLCKKGLPLVKPGSRKKF